MSQRLHRQSDEQRRFVVTGDPIGAQGVAASAAMYDRPFFGRLNPNCDGFHVSETGALTVARGSIDVTTPEAMGAVIAMLGT